LGIKLPPLVVIIWGASIVAQLALCGILIIRGHFRRLPFFAAYVCLNVTQSLLLYPVFRHYGDHSHIAFLVGWWSEAITLLARLFATVEILHLVLISYRGIWGLAWRLLAATSVVVLVCVDLASRGRSDLALTRADRGYHLIFAVALISCLVLIRYYFIHVEPVYKVLLVGFCFYSCVRILLDTILYDYSYQPRHSHSDLIWPIVVVLPYLIVVLFWGAALVYPLPETRKQQVVLPASVYRRISPEINLRLQAINQQLINFWKIEEPQQ
jgi:hypothetical protein